MTIRDTTKPAHLRHGEGSQRRVITDLVTIRATGADTGGAYSLFEVETPSGGGYPPHTQRYEDEAFYVLDGAYVLLLGEDQVELEPGGYAFVPRGTMHAYTNVGPASSRMLVLITPGGIHEQFIEDAGDAGDRPQWQPDMAKVLAVAPKYGIDFLLPSVEIERDRPEACLVSHP